MRLVGMGGRDTAWSVPATVCLMPVFVSANEIQASFREGGFSFQHLGQVLSPKDVLPRKVPKVPPAESSPG